MAALTVLDDDAFTYDWEAGETIAVMGARYGICDSTVSKVAKRMGLQPRRGDVPARLRPPTHPSFALTGGEWVRAANGVMHWRRAPYARA